MASSDVFSDKVQLSCGFETYHAYRWCDVPSGVKKVSTVFIHGILQECRRDRFAINILLDIVKRTHFSVPNMSPDQVISAARKTFEERSWVLVKKEDDIPEMAVPPGVSLDRNVKDASAARFQLKDSSWFYEKVRNRGEWDYKQRGSRYQKFGNFNYGATGAAFGFSEDTLLRMAGWAQAQAGTSRPEWGEAPSKLEAYFGVGGRAPFGDDPADRYWIQRGIEYYRNQQTCR